MSYGEESTCSICLNPIHIEPVCAPPCGHTFHRNCLLGWLQDEENENSFLKRLFNRFQGGGRGRRGTCPVCRVRITEASLIPIYVNSSPIHDGDKNTKKESKETQTDDKKRSLEDGDDDSPQSKKARLGQ